MVINSMDNDQAKKLIKETFENKFDELKFKRFIIELLNLSIDSISDTGYSFNTNNIPNRFIPFIDSFKKITSYKTDNCLIDVLIIKLKKESSKVEAIWEIRGDSRSGLQNR